MYNLPCANIVSLHVTNNPTFSKLCRRDLIIVISNVRLSGIVIFFKGMSELSRISSVMRKI